MMTRQSYFEQVRDYERRLICEALDTQGHQARAAKLLGLSPTTLSSQLRRLEIDPRRFRNKDELFSSQVTEDSTNLPL